MTWIENFLSQNFSKFFWKPLFSTIHPTLFIINISRNFFFKIGKNENFDYKINENCPISITKIGRKWKFWLRNQRPNPPPPPVINRKHLETPPSADYVICERPLKIWRGMTGWARPSIFREESGARATSKKFRRVQSNIRVRQAKSRGESRAAVLQRMTVNIEFWPACMYINIFLFLYYIFVFTILTFR